MLLVLAVLVAVVATAPTESPDDCSDCSEYFGRWFNGLIFFIAVFNALLMWVAVVGGSWVRARMGRAAANP